VKKFWFGIGIAFLALAVMAIAMPVPVAAEGPILPEGYQRLGGAVVGIEVDKLDQMTVTLKMEWEVIVNMGKLLAGHQEVVYPTGAKVTIMDVATPDGWCAPYQRLTGGYILGLGVEPCQAPAVIAVPARTSILLRVKVNGGGIADVSDAVVKLYREDGAFFMGVPLSVAFRQEEDGWYSTAIIIPAGVVDQYNVVGSADGKRPWKDWNLVSPFGEAIDAGARQPVTDAGIKLEFSPAKAVKPSGKCPWWDPRCPN